MTALFLIYFIFLRYFISESLLQEGKILCAYQASDLASHPGICETYKTPLLQKTCVCTATD